MTSPKTARTVPLTEEAARPAVTEASPYDCAVRVRDFLRAGQEPTAFDRFRSQLL